MNAVLDAPDTVRHDAVLMMEAKGLAPAVRSGALSKTWSRLYQGGPYQVDMMMSLEGDSARLVGQLIAADGPGLPGAGTISLFEGERLVELSPIDEAGSFMLDLAPEGCFSLEVGFPGETLRIADLSCH